MAAPMAEDSVDIERVLQQELELLQEIFIHEIEIKNENGYPYEVSLMLHPATADREDLQYVTLTIVFTITKEYPDVVPDIKIKNPRGLSEEEVASLQKRLSEHAAERSGETVLYDLIMIAQESLTSNNTPSCQCVICYHSFEETDEFTRTSCYHYYHNNCLSRLMTYAKQNEETPVCPVCRKELSFTDSQTVTDISDEADATKFTPDPELKAWQEKMAALKNQQAQKGGIIDVTANSNKFLLDISSTPSTPMITITSENRDQGTGSDLTNDKEKGDAPIDGDRYQRSEQGNQSRVVSSYYSYKRGNSNGASGRRGGGRSGGRGGHERGRSRRDGPRPEKEQLGSAGSTKRDVPNDRGGGSRGKGSRGRGGVPSRGRGGAQSRGGGFESASRTKREMGKDGEALDTKNRQEKGAYGRRHEQDLRESEDSVKEEGFNFYGNLVNDTCTQREQRIKNDEAAIQSTETGASMVKAEDERTDRKEELQKNVAGKGSDPKEPKVRERRKITRWRPRENRKDGSTTNGGSDRVTEKSNGRSRDGLKESMGGEKDVTSTNGKSGEDVAGDRHRSIEGCLVDDRKMPLDVKHKIVNGDVGGTNMKEVIRDDSGVNSLESGAHRKTDSPAEMTSDQMRRPLDSQKGTRGGRPWRGRGRRNFSDRESSFTDRKGSSRQQETKDYINRGQRSIGEDSRASSSRVTSGHSQGTKNYHRKQLALAESSSKKDIEQNHLKQGHGRSETVKYDSNEKKNDRLHTNCKTAPPGFDIIPKPRAPPGFEDFR